MAAEGRPHNPNPRSTQAPAPAFDFSGGKVIGYSLGGRSIAPLPRVHYAHMLGGAIWSSIQMTEMDMGDISDNLKKERIFIVLFFIFFNQS